MANGYYQQNSQTQQMPRHSRQAGQYQQYQQPQQYQPREISFKENSATTTGGWVLTLFLMCIPLVNIVLLFVWAFGSNTEPSKQNWARANLIWILIGIIITIILFAIGMAMGIDYREYFTRFYVF